ncbi:MAG: TIGR02677 family protein [Solobacterium sp.]|nr:TIGR02677 family protein [Solobacterium sp.]
MNNYYEAINEVSYLCVPNARIYRSIMHICYIANRQMRFQLYKEDIYEELKKDEYFNNYSMDDLKLDLDQLVLWHNLNAIQDPGIVHTIAEYKNRQFRYSMTEQAVEIERLAERLENLSVESASLSANYFVKIENLLDKVGTLKNGNLDEIYDWWHDLQDVFKTLNQNYQDYLRDFYTVDVKVLVQVMDFVNHKEKFTLYLQEFIYQMQIHSRRIQKMLKDNDETIEKVILTKVVQSELDIPRVINKETNKDVIDQDIRNKYHAFKNWFLPDNGHPAEYTRVLEITNDIIRNVIEKAVNIASINSYGYSRKDDYKKFMEMFINCSDIKEAHKLSAHFFGIQNIEHYRLLHEAENPSFRTSAFNMESDEIELSSNSRSYREKREKEGFSDNEEEKAKQKEKYLKEAEKKKNYMLRYINNGILDIETIEETVPEFVRTTLLSWISNANLSEDKRSITEYGQKFELVRKEGECTLKCQDGNITMPRYEMRFEE